MKKEKIEPFKAPASEIPCDILTPAQGRIFRKNFYLSEMVQIYQSRQERHIPDAEKEILSHYRQRIEEIEAEEAKSSQILHLRCSKALLAIIRRTADAAKISSAGVVRKCVASIKRGREIKWTNTHVSLTGKEILTVPHCEYAGDKDTLRKHIYAKCTEVIAAERRAAKEAFRPEAREGVDYIQTKPEWEK